jgi:hypothetical protein
VLAVPSALLDNSVSRAIGLPSSIHSGRMGFTTNFSVGVPMVMVLSIAITANLNMAGGGRHPEGLQRY